MRDDVVRDASASRPDGAIAYALHKDALARSLVCTAPNFAQVHGEAFAACIPHVTRLGEQAHIGRHPAVLWGADTTIQSVSLGRGDEFSSYLPSWYRLCNPVCTQCHVPLVGGWTATRVPYYRRHRHRRSNKHDAKFVHSTCTATKCTLCQHQQASAKPASARCFSNVRQRQRQRAAILAGQVSESKPAIIEHPKKNRVASPPQPPSAPSIPNSAILPLSASKRRATDNKAGLRALLQQKKQKEENASKKPAGGLAHFLQQL